MKGMRDIWKISLQRERKLTSSFAKLESELAISKNITTAFSERLVHMEKPYWANAQYSQGECVEVVGIPSTVHHSQLKDSVCKIFDKLNCNIVKDDLVDCYHLKGDRVIVKLSKRKDCKQVLSVKNDLKNINIADLDVEENGSIYIN